MPFFEREVVWIQHLLELRPRPRGFHLVTDEITSAIPELSEVQTGLLHLMLQHTSASLLVTENADPDVRADLDRFVAFSFQRAAYLDPVDAESAAAQKEAGHKPPES